MRYVLAGSVRRARGSVRISTQLVEAESGAQLWAERFDRDLDDIFAVQDEIAAAVAIAIEPAISLAEQQRIARKAPENLDAWEAAQRGLWHMARNNVSDLARAGTYLAQAVRLDPSFAAAYAELAWVHIYEGVTYTVRPLREGYHLALQWAEEALRRDPLNSDAHAAISMANNVLGTPAAVAFHYEQALAIDPNSVRARRGKAVTLLFSGQPAEARAIMRDLLGQSPHDETAAVNRAQIVMSYCFEHDFAAAVEAAKEAIATHPGYPVAYRWLAVALGHLGQAEQAEAALRRAIDMSPEIFDAQAHERPPWFRRAEDYDVYLDGLRKAGWRG